MDSRKLLLSAVMAAVMMALSAPVFAHEGHDDHATTETKKAAKKHECKDKNCKDESHDHHGKDDHKDEHKDEHKH